MQDKYCKCSTWELQYICLKSHSDILLRQWDRLTSLTCHNPLVSLITMSIILSGLRFSQQDNCPSCPWSKGNLPFWMTKIVLSLASHKTSIPERDLGQHPQPAQSSAHLFWYFASCHSPEVLMGKLVLGMPFPRFILGLGRMWCLR